MNRKSAIFKTNEVPDRTREAVEASDADQVFLVFDTAQHNGEQRLAVKKIFVYDDNLVSLIE